MEFNAADKCQNNIIFKKTNKIKQGLVKIVVHVHCACIVILYCVFKLNIKMLFIIYELQAIIIMNSI